MRCCGPGSKSELRPEEDGEHMHFERNVEAQDQAHLPVEGIQEVIDE